MLNTYPPDTNEINTFCYRCQNGNAVLYAAGDRDKRRDERGCNMVNEDPPLPQARPSQREAAAQGARMGAQCPHSRIDHYPDQNNEQIDK